LFPELGFFWIFLSNLMIFRQFSRKSYPIDGRIPILPRSRKKTIASKRILRHTLPVSTLLHHSESGKAHSHHGIAIQARQVYLSSRIAHTIGLSAAHPATP